MKLIKPKPLKRGDTLGIVACSTPITSGSESTIQRCYGYLREKGFRIVEAPNCRKLTGHAAGTVRERVDALHRFFKDPKIDGILSYWGGFQSHQLLEHMDYELIRKNPKPFIGFSDTTALHAGIHAKTGLVSFLGPAGITFGKPAVPDFTWENFEKVLIQPSAPFELGVSETFSDNPWYREPEQKMRFESNPGWKTYRKGRAEGPIIGGNAGTMLLLAGTEYWPDLKGRILFVEDDEAESSRTMDRMFTQLRQLGAYDQIRGMVIGRFHRDVKFRDDDSLEMILDEALRGYRFPVVTGVDFGHTDPLITIPMGIRCRIDTAKSQIAYLETGVVSSSSGAGWKARNKRAPSGRRR